MERQLVFIPVPSNELDAIEGGTSLAGREAHTVTPELLAALGYTSEQLEDAEYAALVIASVAALARYGRRLVLVAELDASSILPGEDPANGGCVVAEVPPTSMTCWFSEADGVDVADAAAAASGLDIDTAWDFTEVQDLLHDHDLLWNDVEEYRRQAASGH
ncbi:hypothetical protein LKO27_05110 [Tessaracoccus sp. OS52]|uniref:DUF6912 family protein n=1 Tax=Tessaracoccus sp. OS52 TaxID=2886691 RepID=UPI001D12B400|nr:hypothetical protein [Tessaracoccus sp. OS52]MCC2592795.1 hypothetical protein [Tessaracoccus sp. OS52]